MDSAAQAPLVLFYDGVCGLCDRIVQFVLDRDRHSVFRFATLQGELAARVLTRHGKDPSRLDTLYLVVDYGGPHERVLSKGRAAVQVLTRLGGVYRAAALLQIVPAFVLNWAYDAVAFSRYRIFGKLETCRVPTPEERAKFLDASP